jgi:hypothetical protein
VVYYLTEEVFSITFIATEILICFLARFISIFGLSFLFRLCLNWKVYNNELAVICAAGTIRGSVALALILSLDGSGANRSTVSIVKSTVLIMVCITTIVLGGMMPNLIKFFMGDRTKESAQTAEESQFSDPQLSQAPLKPKEEAEAEGGTKPKKPPGFFKKIENKYLKRWLIYDYDNRKESFKIYKKVIKANNLDLDRKSHNRMLVLRNLQLLNYEVPQRKSRSTPSLI